MKMIRDTKEMLGWEQGDVQMALCDEGLFVLGGPGGERFNFRVTTEGVELLVGDPLAMARALLSLTGEDPAGLLARFAAFT